MNSYPSYDVPCPRSHLPGPATMFFDIEYILESDAGVQAMELSAETVRALYDAVTVKR